jgi:hypothetical protein
MFTPHATAFAISPSSQAKTGLGQINSGQFYSVTTIFPLIAALDCYKMLFVW